MRRQAVGPGRTALIAAALLVSGCSHATSLSALPDPSIQTAESIIRSLASAEQVPAVSAAVVRDGEIVWSEAVGMADVELRTPATSATKFRLASVSKLLTAVVAARLAQRGTVDLEAPVSTYLADLPQQHRSTTLAQLLGHLGGVRHYSERDYDAAAPGGTIDTRSYASTREALALFIADPLVAPPGTRYEYSTFGYTLAGAVLEAATGRPFLDLIEDELATPLGLTSLQPDRPLEIIPDRVGFYQRAEPFRSDNPWIAGEFVNAPAVNPAYKWAGGGFLMTPSDLARFGAAATTPGFLEPGVRSAMLTPGRLPDGTATGVGLGWRIDRDSKGRLRWHHAGSMEGARSVLVVYPELMLSVALMTNVGAAPRDVLAPAERLADAFSR